MTRGYVAVKDQGRWESFIRVRFQWSGLHSWPDAPDSHSFLRNEHRHLFEGIATLQVGHDDRELEFFEVLDWLESTEMIKKLSEPAHLSCEQMAKLIAGALLARYGNREITVEVYEDGENGGKVTWKPKMRRVEHQTETPER